MKPALVLLALMTVSYGRARHVSDYTRTATANYERRSDDQIHGDHWGYHGNHGVAKRHDRPTTMRPQWEQQQVLQVIIPTEPTNRVLSAGERRYPDYNPEDIRTQQSTYSSHRTSSHQSRPHNDWDRRINIEDEDCDDTGGSQAHRRSASQDSDARSQHTIRSTPSPSPCRPKPTSETTRKPHTHHGTLPRPPSTSSTGNQTISRPGHTEKALGNIVFPDGNMFPAFVPRRLSCDDSTFCDVSEDYPVNHINDLLKKNEGLFKGLFGTDQMPDPELKNRIDQSDDSPLCAATEQVVFPKNAQNKENKWLFVVNQAPYLQGVRIETCVKEGPCQLTEGLPMGYRTFCKQKYIYRKMLSLNEQGEAASDSFKLPSCCSCYVKMDPVARMGGMSPLPKNMTPKNKNN